jgi:HEAT repeat protein
MTNSDATDNRSARHGSQPTPLDMRRVTEALIELNIARKNIFIYPTIHNQVKRSVVRARQALEQLFEFNDRLTVGVAQETLLIGREYLDPRNAVFKEFASSLKARSVALLTLHRGVSDSELIRFFRWLADADENEEDGDPDGRTASGRRFAHIAVERIDYNKFVVTEEQEIGPSGEKTSGGDSDLIWQDFISQLMDAGGIQEGQGADQGTAPHLDAHRIAQFLNQQQIDPQRAVQSYDKIVASHLHQISRRQRSPQVSQQTLADLNTLLNELNPKMRQQFLAVTFKHCSALESTSAEFLLKGLSPQLVISMLKQANTQGEEISPSLLHLIQKLAATHDDGATPVSAPGQEETPPPSEDQEALKRFQTLFQREQYESFVTQEYDQVLEKLRHPQKPLQSPDKTPISTDELRQSTDERHLDRQIGKALMAILEGLTSPEEYRQDAERLWATVASSIQGGDFSFPLALLQLLRRHSRDKTRKEIRAMAQQLAENFVQPDFVQQVVSAYDLQQGRSADAEKLIIALGPVVVPALVAICVTKAYPRAEMHLLRPLGHMKKETVVEIRRFLRDPRTSVVAKLTDVLRQLKMVEAGVHLRPLIENADNDVRLAALAALLSFRDPWGIVALRRFLGLKNRAVAATAVGLAGEYRVTEVVPDLVAGIRRAIFRKSTFTRNETIIKALGKIGDPAALPLLSKLARSVWPLFPRRMKHLKQTVYRSLEGYPRQRIQPLVNIGLHASDDAVRQICSLLVE